MGHLAKLWADSPRATSKLWADSPPATPLLQLEFKFGIWIFNKGRIQKPQLQISTDLLEMEWKRGPLNGRFGDENLMYKKLTEFFRDWSF